MCGENGIFQTSQGCSDVRGSLKNVDLSSAISLEIASRILLATELRFKIETAKEHEVTGCINRIC